MKIITFFNNKGGVGKTTLAVNIASYMSKQKKKKIGSTGIDVVILFLRVYQYYSDIFQLYGFMSSLRARSQAEPGNESLESIAVRYSIFPPHQFRLSQKIKAKNREPIDNCAKYLINKSPYLRYDHYLAEGFPITTGVIEGACRHLVKDRLEITAKWRLKSAETVLRLRALRSSRDFEEYWKFHEACKYKRNHQDLYADGVVPQTVKSRSTAKRDHLKIIK